MLRVRVVEVAGLSVGAVARRRGEDLVLVIDPRLTAARRAELICELLTAPELDSLLAIAMTAEETGP